MERLKLGFKRCKWCKEKVLLKITRDIVRKNFCSRSCRQKWRYRNGEFTWMKRMQEKNCLPENNIKKGHKGKTHPKWIKDRNKVVQKKNCKVILKKIHLYFHKLYGFKANEKDWKMFIKNKEYKNI